MIVFRNIIRLFVFLVFITSVLKSEVRLPKLISDGMVIQRDAKVKIWGWASPDEKVSVNFNNHIYNSTANNKCEWFITLTGLKSGGPYEMTIEGSNVIVVKDILVGDVWVCSGQSNMETTMKRVSPLYEKEIASSENPNIRYFEVPDYYNFNLPQNDLPGGKWQKPDPQTVLNFSAVCFFFAQELYEKYKVPVGLINAAVGGSPAESWISEEALKEFPNHYNEAQKYKDSSLIENISREETARIREWYQKLNKNDEGYKTAGLPWYNPSTDITEWKNTTVPGYWSETPLNGVFWFRKDINIPSSIAGKKARLNLGRIIDADSVFVNGIFVGTTSYQYPPRRYEIPEGVLKTGINTIVVRLISNSGKGEFVQDKPYEIKVGEELIDLKGEWKYRIGAVMEPSPATTSFRTKPLGLYNAMIAPLINFSIKGILWYQGEANADKYQEYNKLFTALIKDWRKQWEQEDLPFLFVQLPNLGARMTEPSEGNWAGLREAQFKTLSVPYTAMAVAIDLGEWNDIHPLNKKEVSKRLALAARKLVYKDDNVIFTGPIYQSMEIADNKCVLNFTNTGSGLIYTGNEGLKYFAIAGSDRKFVWAKAKIEDNKVIVWNDDIKNPVAVRYAWADNPEGANLYNKEGLPASPFRTDNFTIINH